MSDIDLQETLRDLLYGRLNEEDCPYREYAGLARRIQELLNEISDHYASPAAYRAQIKMLKNLKTLLKQAIDDPECGYRELTPISRRLQIMGKEIATINEKLKHSGGKGGRTNVSGDAPYDPDQI